MTVELTTSILSPSAKILEAGGWFIPFYKATHVVDLMPYETRGGVLHLDPLPGERFSKSTWHQVDFLKPRFKLPFPDKFFDFSVCGHTVEDLADPSGLLDELLRVSKAGYIETPSRLSEQTIGVRDRMTNAQGHPHHHWIVESENNHLLLSRKDASLLGSLRQHAVPLRTYESIVAKKPASPIMSFYWDGDFSWGILSTDDAIRRARTLVSSYRISTTDRVVDLLIRKLRRLKQNLRHASPINSNNWWQAMITISRPYSTIPL